MKIDANEEFYIAYFKERDNAFEYIGLADTTSVERQRFGVECYKGKDIYAGEHSNDIREGLGLYFFKSDENVKGEEPEDPKPNNVTRLYFGEWDNNLKNGLGAIVFKKEYANVVIYEGFEGNFKEDKSLMGVSYEEQPNGAYCAYYGSFKDEKKHDTEGLFYVFYKDEYDEEHSVIFGSVEEDIFGKGVKFNFKDDDKLLNFIVFELEKNQTEHRHLGQGESEVEMEKEELREYNVKGKYEKAIKLYKIVKEERENFKANYESLFNKEKELKEIDSFEKFYQQYGTLQPELAKPRQSNLSVRLFKDLPKK